MQNADELKADGLNFVNDDSDIVRESKERWDRWLAVYSRDLPFSELYLNGRLQIAVKLSIGGHSDRIDCVACLSADKEVRERVATNSTIEGDARYSGQRCDDPVLVEVGKFVQCGQVRVPTIVRLYVVKNGLIEGLGDRYPIFKSLLHGTYYAPRRISHREVGLSGDLISNADRCRKGVVERFSGVGDGVTSDEGYLGGEGLRLQLNETLARIGLVIDVDFIAFGDIECGPLKVIDVMYGPT